MVGRRVLVPLIGVRVPIPEQNLGSNVKSLDETEDEIYLIALKPRS